MKERNRVYSFVIKRSDEFSIYYEVHQFLNSLVTVANIIII